MKVAQRRKGTANHDSAAPSGSQGLQGLSCVGVTDLEVIHSEQSTVLESICYTTWTQCLNTSLLNNEMPLKYYYYDLLLSRNSQFRPTENEKCYFWQLILI